MSLSSLEEHGIKQVAEVDTERQIAAVGLVVHTLVAEVMSLVWFGSFPD